MWIFLNNAFLSVVQHEHEPDSLLVRARLDGDLQRIFPNAKVTHTPEADYAYRTVVSRDSFARTLGEMAEKINYPNFKNSVEEHERHDAYMDVWFAMRNLQDRRTHQRKR